MLLKIYPENPNPKAVNTVVECLQDGGIVIYPTDTIYGIGGRAGVRVYGTDFRMQDCETGISASI